MSAAVSRPATPLGGTSSPILKSDGHIDALGLGKPLTKNNKRAHTDVSSSSSVGSTPTRPPPTKRSKSSLSQSTIAIYSDDSDNEGIITKGMPKNSVLYDSSPVTSILGESSRRVSSRLNSLSPPSSPQKKHKSHTKAAKSISTSPILKRRATTTGTHSLKRTASTLSAPPTMKSRRAKQALATLFTTAEAAEVVTADPNAAKDAELGLGFVIYEDTEEEWRQNVLEHEAGILCLGRKAGDGEDGVGNKENIPPVGAVMEEDGEGVGSVEGEAGTAAKGSELGDLAEEDEEEGSEDGEQEQVHEGEGDKEN